MSHLKWVGLGLCLLGFQGRADEAQKEDDLWKEVLGGSGSLRADYWSRDKSYSDASRNSLPTSVWINLKPKEMAGFRLGFDGYAMYNDLPRNTTSYEGEIREGYLAKSFGDFDIKVGRQVIVWGRADQVNPTDNLAVKNLNLLMTDTDDQRLGTLALQASYTLSSSGSTVSRFIGVWQPEWRRPVYPIPPVSGVTFSNNDPTRPESQFAFKFDQTGGSVDWSLSYFSGYNKTPDLFVNSIGPSGVNLALEYNHIQVVGGDLAFNLGDTAFRAEGAYTLSAYPDGSNPLKQNSNFYGVFGADRALFENFNLNVQTLYRHVYGFVDLASYSDPNVVLLATQEAQLANETKPDLFGASVRPSYKMLSETLEMEVAGVVWFQNTSALLRPKVTYAFTDHLKGTVGAEWYTGDQNGYFGRISSASTVFAEGRFVF